MGAGRPTRWQSQDTTIRALYGLPPKASGRAATSARADAAQQAAAGVMLSHDSFRALFDGLDPASYVDGVIAACYLGVSRAVIERKLADTYGRGNRSWRGALEALDSGAPPGPALNDMRYRWSFVTKDITQLLYREMTVASHRRDDLRLRTPERAKLQRVPLLSLGSISECVQFVVDRKKRVVGALGQAHIDASMLIGTIAEGGRLLALEPVQALSMAWTDIFARAAWETVVLEALLVQADAVRTTLARGRAATDALLAKKGGAVRIAAPRMVM